MTDGEKESHKEKVRKVMIDHLTELGYPDKITDEQIMAELKDMWVKLENAGLVVEDMNFEAFQAFANHFYLLAQVNDMLNI